MGGVAAARDVPERRRRPSPSPGHLDFEALLGPAWADLPAAVQARFRAARAACIYEGEMEVRSSAVGWILAQLCRLIGTPLAPWRGAAVPVAVRVRTDADGALVWDRLYAFPGRAPVLVSSRKTLDRTGLVEVVRCGLGMRLALSVEDGALHFRSRRYVWRVGPWTVPAPLLLTPGEAHIVHADEGGGRFRFVLRFVHPWFGETLHQEGVFRDSGDRPET